MKNYNNLKSMVIIQGTDYSMFLNIITSFLFFFLTANSIITAQVAGISGSKISTYTVNVVDHHKVEFEPAFYHFRSSKLWDGNGNLKDLSINEDSTTWITGLNFRITYGLLDKFEIGASFSSDLLIGNIGMRYVLYNKKYTGLAIIGGINIPMGNKTVSNSIRLSNTVLKAGGGLVFSAYFNPDFSLDMNAQYFSFIEESIDNGNGNLYINSDLGYYFLTKQLQVIVGVGYQLSQYNSFNTQLITIYPGITIETGKQYIIVLSSLFDIWGINASKNAGLAIALTITLE